MGNKNSGRKKDPHSAAVNRWRTKNVRKYEKYKKTLSCEICGYNKCIAALHFHHRDPKDKKGSICMNVRRQSWETTLEEIGKCQVVCANCHTELHHN